MSMFTGIPAGLTNMWTGADLYAGFDDLKVDGDTGTESLYFEMNGFGFSLVYNAN